VTGDPTPELTTEQARELASRWAETRGRRFADEHVAMAVVARGLRAEGVASVGAESAEQAELLHQTADAGLMEYIGEGHWVLTEDGELVLSPGERERLLAWVRREVDRRLASSDCNDPQSLASEHINEMLELSDDDDEAAWGLCAAALGDAWELVSS
jgi:hypothetical protein